METQPKPWYASYKLIAAAVGLVLIFVNAYLNHQTVDNNTVTLAVMGVISAYIASKAYEDSSQAQARATVTAANVTAATQASTTTISTPGASDVTVSTSDAPKVETIGLV